MRQLLELNVETTHAAVDLLVWWLEERGALGTAVVDPVELAVDVRRAGALDFGAEQFLSQLGESATVSSWWSLAGEDASSIRCRLRAENGFSACPVSGFQAHLASFLSELGVESSRFSQRLILEEDWAESWKKYYEPLRFGRHLVVAPSWQPFTPQPGDRVLSLDPGMAFGTGQHETTALLLNWLEGVIRPGDRVLDFGCGSGILALCASLLGAAEVWALDVDPLAVRQARTNARDNGLRLMVREGGLEAASGAYDVILANIVQTVLQPLAGSLRNRLLPGGRLLLSGVLEEAEAEFVGAFMEVGLQLEDRKVERGWLAVSFVRP